MCAILVHARLSNAKELEWNFYCRWCVEMHRVVILRRTSWQRFIIFECMYGMYTFKTIEHGLLSNFACATNCLLQLVGTSTTTANGRVRKLQLKCNVSANRIRTCVLCELLFLQIFQYLSNSIEMSIWCLLHYCQVRILWIYKILSF